MRRIVRMLGILTIGGGAVYVARAGRRAKATERTTADVLKADFRGFVTHRFDPVVMGFGLVGGRVSPWATLEHVGRTTGSIHRTPVFPQLRDDLMFIPLPYGTDVQWVKNVLAAGHCRLQLHESIYELDEPAIVSPLENTTLSLAAHQALDRGDRHYMRLHVLDKAPGTFTDPPAEFTTHPAPKEVPEIVIEHPAPTAEHRTPVASGG